jgi:hypothetical protein
MAARGFLGAGDLYIARYNAGTGLFDAFKGPYEAAKFEIKPNVELKELSSRGRSSYGQVIESVPLPQPADFTVELNEVNRESLSLALLGTDTAYTQGSGTVTDEVMIAKKDSWVQLTKEKIAAVVLTNSGATVTYVEGVDYEVNARMGWIKILPGSVIIEDASLKVDYTYAAVAGTLIRGATNSQVRAKFRLDGVNFADGLPVIVDVWEAVIATDSAFDFLSSDFATVNLPGRLKTPAGKTEPFTVKLLNTA